MSFAKSDMCWAVSAERSGENPFNITNNDLFPTFLNTASPAKTRLPVWKRCVVFMWRFIDSHNEGSLWGWCINQLWAMHGFVVPHINTLRGSSRRAGYVADLRCKQQAFSEDLGHSICACLWLCGSEGDLWRNPEYPRLYPRLPCSWGQRRGTWSKPCSWTSVWSLPSTCVPIRAVNITRPRHQQNQFKVICSCLKCSKV